MKVGFYFSQQHSLNLVSTPKESFGTRFPVAVMVAQT